MSAVRVLNKPEEGEAAEERRARKSLPAATARMSRAHLMIGSIGSRGKK